MRINRPKKKALGIIGALAIVVLLLPLFAAFEAHVINVVAEIDSTLEVAALPTDFGSVFSHEIFETSFTVSLSDSLIGKAQVVSLDYQVSQESVVLTDTVPPVVYRDLRPFIYVQSDPSDHDQDTETSAALNSHMNDTSDTWVISVHVPCVSSGQCKNHGTPECPGFPCGGPRYSNCQTISEDPPGSGSAGEWAADIWIEAKDYRLDDFGALGSCGDCHDPDAICIMCHSNQGLPQSFKKKGNFDYRKECMWIEKIRLQ